MDKESKIKLERTEVALLDMKENKQITEETYYKLLLAVARDWMVGEEFMTARRIVENIPSSFYVEGFLEAAKDDPVFVDNVFTLATLMIEKGLTTLEQYSFHKPPALA